MSCRNAARTATCASSPSFARHDARRGTRPPSSGSARSGRSWCGTSGVPSAGESRDAGRAGPARRRPPRLPCAPSRPVSAFTFSTTSSIRAGWMRPSAMSRSMACLAISRRYGSKPDRMIAPGVSSTIRSTPVASSSARMLRPSRPMMRPFRSSLGRSTTETVVSMACSAALRWMASVMILLGAGGGRLARFGVEALDEVGRVAPRVAFDLLQQQLLGFVGRQAGDALQLVLLLRDELLVLRGGAPRRPSRARAIGAFARLQVLLELLGGREPLGERLVLRGERPARASRRLLAPVLRPGARPPSAISCAFSLASSSASFLRFSASRSASRRHARRLFLGAADGLGGDPLAVGDPDGEPRPPDGGRDADRMTTIGMRVPSSVVNVAVAFLSSALRRSTVHAGLGSGSGGRDPAISGERRERRERPRFAVWGGR